MYNYVERSYEINQLYLAISKTTKTLSFASKKLDKDDKAALLNYQEVAQIFGELGNIRN